MSHSKFTKRGNSLYVDNWNPAAKKFINTCSVCGAEGYDPSIDEEGFVYDNAGNITNSEHRAIRTELQRILNPLPLDHLGRCSTCSRIMDKN